MQGRQLHLSRGLRGAEYRVTPAPSSSSPSSAVVDVDEAIREQGEARGGQQQQQQQQQEQRNRQPLQQGHPPRQHQQQQEQRGDVVVAGKVRFVPEALANLLSAFSGLYAMVLVAVYMAFIFTELVTFPRYQLFLEVNGFFVYLYALAVLFLGYVLAFTLTGARSLVVYNHKSHGSLTIRLGALVFSAGALCYFGLETVSFAEVRSESPCYKPTLGANVALALAFVALQTYVIFVYPRLNLGISPAIDRFGLMHLVATNIILWIRTLLKESLHEISESEEEAHEGELGEGGAGRTEATATPRSGTEHLFNRPAHDHGNCSFMIDRIRQYEHKQTECLKYHDDLLGDALLRSSPYLYPFVIEFALIGASVAFVMWRHVGRSSSSKQDVSLPVQRPNPREFIRKGDCSHSFKGILGGLAVMFLALLNLGLFFGLDGHQANENESELYSKATNTAINILGLIVLTIGIVQIQKLRTKRKDSFRAGAHSGSGSNQEKLEEEYEEEEEEDERTSSDLDLALLRFTAFFAYIYLSFTVITGAFNHHVEDFPNALHIVNGVAEAAQITLQIAFIIDLKEKRLPPGGEASMPGRQVTIFLSILNLAQWLVVTFEIQKVRASVVEADFYGFMPWVIIQRVTLPLTVFFRFHSAVVNMELWKEIYCKPSQ